MGIASTAILAFAGGSLVATVISAFVKHCIFYPVISVSLDRKKGSYGPVPFYTNPDENGKQTYSHEGRYLRLRIENTGYASIKDCCGLITEIAKSTSTTVSSPQPEVIDLGWSHHSESKTRNIPRGAYFYMDLVTMELRPERRLLRLSTPCPTTLINFFEDKATYTLKILIAADNARPQRDITVTFDYDPKSDDLSFIPLDATRLPWWRRLQPRLLGMNNA